MAETEGEEHFETSWLGECEEVKEINVGDNDFIYISGVKALKAVSIMIRGPNDYMIDEVERSVHDALCVVRRVLESNKVLSLSNLLLLSLLSFFIYFFVKVVAGGGAVEVALSIYLEDFAKTLGSKE
jgi:T-complex protein 1 subunit alpha